MEKKKLEIINITNHEELVYLIRRFKNGPNFARAFRFESNSLKLQFFESIGVDLESFCKLYFYYDKTKNIHISESEFGYLWISTLGLVSPFRFIKDKTISAFESQHFTLSLLITVQ